LERGNSKSKPLMTMNARCFFFLLHCLATKSSRKRNSSLGKRATKHNKQKLQSLPIKENYSEANPCSISDFFCRQVERMSMDWRIADKGEDYV